MSSDAAWSPRSPFSREKDMYPTDLVNVITEVYKAGTAEGAKKGWRTRRYGGQVSADNVLEQINKLPVNRTQVALKKAQIRTDLLKLLREPKLSMGLKKKIKESMAELAALNGAGDDPITPKERAAMRQAFTSVGKLMKVAGNSMPKSIKVPEKQKPPMQQPAAKAPVTPTQQAQKKDETPPTAPQATDAKKPPIAAEKKEAPPVDQTQPMKPVAKPTPEAKPDATKPGQQQQAQPAKPKAPPETTQAQGGGQEATSPKAIVETAKTWQQRAGEYLDSAFKQLEDVGKKWGNKLKNEISYRVRYNDWSAKQSKATKLFNRAMPLMNTRTKDGIPPKAFYDLAEQYNRAQDSADASRDRFMSHVDTHRGGLAAFNKSSAVERAPQLVSPYGA